MEFHQLLFVLSMFSLESFNDISHMLDLQPDPSLFFKSFAELDHSNLMQIFSFEGRIIRKLL